MITAQQPVSNFYDNTTGQLVPQPAEFPSSANGQTFSIQNGFTFQVAVNVSDLPDGETVSFGLIQIVSASVRVMGNASNGASITLASYPMLDGDVAQTLWYNQGTARALNVGNGTATVSLGDNPATNCAVCSGPMLCVNVNEAFVIVLAQLLPNNQYVALEQWGWGYACAATRSAPSSGWVDASGQPVTDVQTTFGVDPQQPSLDFDPQVRANQQSVTVNNCANCVCP